MLFPHHRCNTWAMSGWGGSHTTAQPRWCSPRQARLSSAEEGATAPSPWLPLGHLLHTYPALKFLPCPPLPPCAHWTAIGVQRRLAAWKILDGYLFKRALITTLSRVSENRQTQKGPCLLRSNLSKRNQTKVLHSCHPQVKNYVFWDFRPLQFWCLWF